MKKILKEAGTKSSTLFGGQNNRVVVPPDGTHAGQSGWQSGNGYDIFNQPGTPVYAISSGKVYKLDDYKGFRQENGKKLYGVKLTVDSSDNLPDVYYAHLERPAVQNGQTVTCGQLLGYIKLCPPQVGKPESSHVHIAVERGSITAFLNKDGSIKCTNGQQINDTGSENSSTGGSSDDPFGLAIPDSNNSFIGGITKDLVGKSLGQDVVNAAKKLNSSIDSRPLLQEANSEKGSFVFCNISSVSVRNGDKVNKDKSFGVMNRDVSVTKYDFYGNKVRFDKKELNGKKLIQSDYYTVIIPFSDNNYVKSPVSGIVSITTKSGSTCNNKVEIEFSVSNYEKKDTKKTEDDYNYTDSKVLGIELGRNYDPLIRDIANIIPNFFKDKKDKKTGETIKRFGWPGQDVAPSDWNNPKTYIKDSIDENIKRINELINYKKNIL